MFNLACLNCWKVRRREQGGYNLGLGVLECDNTHSPRCLTGWRADDIQQLNGVNVLMRKVMLQSMSSYLAYLAFFPTTAFFLSTVQSLIPHCPPNSSQLTCFF